MSRLREALRSRLADALVAESGIDSRCKIAELKKDDRLKLLKVLTEYEIAVKGHQGYRKAEVTGGVALDELNTASMESRQGAGNIFAARCAACSVESVDSTFFGRGAADVSPAKARLAKF